jgi:hypothetical protein
VPRARTLFLANGMRPDRVDGCRGWSLSRPPPQHWRFGSRSHAPPVPMFAPQQLRKISLRPLRRKPTRQRPVRNPSSPPLASRSLNRQRSGAISQPARSKPRPLRRGRMPIDAKSIFSSSVIPRPVLRTSRFPLHRPRHRLRHRRLLRHRSRARRCRLVPRPARRRGSHPSR